MTKKASSNVGVTVQAERRKPRTVRKILIIDDNRKAAMALRKLLEMDGYTVEVADSGEAGLIAASIVNPDTIILDLNLPGKDGYEVARTLRKELGSSALLIALTGYYGQTKDKLKARQAGFDDYLTRPVLVAEIEKVFGSRPGK